MQNIIEQLQKHEHELRSELDELNICICAKSTAQQFAQVQTAIKSRGVANQRASTSATSSMKKQPIDQTELDRLSDNVLSNTDRRPINDCSSSSRHIRPESKSQARLAI
jgi:hypothetical protein